MKRILFILPALAMGGLEKTLITLANSLVSIRYDVTIMVWKPKLVLKSLLDERVKVVYRAPNLHLGNKIPYIRHKYYDDDMWDKRADSKQYYRYYIGGKNMMLRSRSCMITRR